MLVCRFITDHFAGYLSVSLRDHLISYLAGRLRELLTGQVAGHLLQVHFASHLLMGNLGGHPYIAVHIGPACGHIANSMALKNCSIWLNISAMGYI
jgi:hypothetical protein